MIASKESFFWGLPLLNSPEFTPARRLVVFKIFSVEHAAEPENRYYVPELTPE
jgi:hypothetical protein